MKHFSKLNQFLQTKLGKKLTLSLGVFFYMLVFIAFVYPKPFIQAGYLGMFVFSLLGPATLVVPLLARHFDPLTLSLVAAIGMTINDTFVWFIGRSGDLIFPRTSKVIRFEKHIQKYGVLALFFWSLVPFPNDFIAIIAGYLEVPIKKFAFPVFIGRLIRLYIVATGTIAFFGNV